ncbi:alpha/beta fold hydrolase [Solirubrobacter sp. CPCC 204708]|uniref:Alpha/beta fold hydrolase n=1 Tax=Solirubrobacter deserti TaxID=2282478 RepID=A0ABT4RL83_9ACTN|nr:alpha/beta fold hydrolase [Solirubrobacter deserti]MBE2318983.1 alpha/beta fold hydrolase [Solirubrobacter deserti]MDA0139292.1 alpha/beta fold hydrolase [Solirubrobacter deserti]
MKRLLILTWLMLFSRREPVSRTPAEVGLDFEPVSFPATDGVDIKGWFVPAKGEGPKPAIVFVHGWMWNRLGNVAGKAPIDDRDVDFLPATKALVDAGYSVLMYDIRGHGESARGRSLLSFGPVEKRDFVGAVNYLRTRADVDGERIGSIGISMGGTIALYGAPECQPVKAVLAVQPAKVTTFNYNFALDQWGPLGPAIVAPIELIYRIARTPPPSVQDPGEPAKRLDGTVVRYVQGTGDRWGTMVDVLRFAEGTPTLDGPVVHYPSSGRYDGYRYVSAETDDIVDFFRRNL